MPLYKYLCSKCGHELIEIQGLNEDPIKTCPQCNEDTLQKLIGNVTPRFKGSGFHATDYGKN